MSEQKWPRLKVGDAVLLVVDMQEKLVPVVRESQTLVRRASRLIEGCQALKVPVIATEQYRQGLGPTVHEIARLLEGVKVHDKMRFSACIEPVREALEVSARRSVIVVGVETHICVLQTCLDLLGEGFDVYLPWDGTSSRRRIDRDAALRRLGQVGVVPTTVESIFFEMVREAGTEAFRSIRQIVHTTED